MLQPIGVNTDKVLLYGNRRLKAWGWVNNDKPIPVLILDIKDEFEGRLFEYAENKQRKDMSWQKDVKSVHLIHRMGIEKHGKATQGQRTDIQKNDSWTQQKTASALNLSVGKVSESLKLYEAMKKYPEVKEAHPRSEALRRLRIIEGRETKSGKVCHYCNRDLRKGVRSRNLVLCADCYRERIKKPKKKQITDALLSAS